MPMKTYPMKVEDGKVYAEVTLRDVVERCDVSDLPILAEVKRLYDENAKLRGLVRDMMRFFEDGDYCTACEKSAECDAQEEYDDSCLMRGVFHVRMRELGVEVDE